VTRDAAAAKHHLPTLEGLLQLCAGNREAIEDPGDVAALAGRTGWALRSRGFTHQRTHQPVEIWKFASFVMLSFTTMYDE